MRRRLACADFTFPLLPHDKVLQLIAMLDFEGVDIGLFEGRSHLWPSRQFEHVEQSARQLRAALERHGLLLAGVFLQRARAGRLQAPLKDNTTDYRRVLEVMAQTGYAGWLGIEYVWTDWEHCNECDNLSETILFRDLLKGAVSQA